MDRNTSRALDRWLTDDAHDYGAADAPTADEFADYVREAAARNELETRRAALAARLLRADTESKYAIEDFEHAVWAFTQNPNARTASTLAELIIDLIDDAL